MSDRQLLTRLLAATKNGGGLESLRDALEQIVFADQEEKNRATKLVAIAHLTAFHSQPRELIHAVELLAKIEDWETLQTILKIGRDYGRLDLVQRIDQIGKVRSLPALQVLDFADWLQRFGIYWIDLDYDTENDLVFVTPEVEKNLRQTVDENFDSRLFWSNLAGQVPWHLGLTTERKIILAKLAAGQNPVCRPVTKHRQNVDKQFSEYCENNGLEIVKTLQVGIESARRCSYVYLVRDTDGIMKAYKEILDYRRGPLAQTYDSEDELYQKLGQNDFLPPYYGTVRLDDDLRFAKLGFHYAQSLADYLHEGQPLEKNLAIRLALQLAKKLDLLHQNGIAYLDLKPENVAVTDSDAKLFDLGISRQTEGDKKFNAFVADPRYGTPEIGLELTASTASDVFQLGVLFHQLLTGHHPFALAGEVNNRDEQILHYFWPTTVLPYEHDLAEDLQDSRLGIIAKMLDKNPERRPTLEQVIAALETSEAFAALPAARRSQIRTEEKNTVLFPARLGIPHTGHIEYIARLLQLGFHVTISLQRSYTITDRDPLPKWLVAKMVARSLLDRGFTPDDFDIILTPFYGTKNEMRMHFAMMPGVENIVAVASSNPGVHELFDRYPIFDQKTVFGSDGENYEDRSWGEIIRRAVRENDYQTFCEYAASGVEQILPFEQTREIYGRPAIEFVTGAVRVALLDDQGVEQANHRLFRYVWPEASLLRHLARAGHNVELVDLYANDTLIKIDGQVKKLKYLRTELSAQDEIIYFQIT